MFDYFDLRFDGNYAHILEDSPGACIIRIDFDLADDEWTDLINAWEAAYGVTIEDHP